MRIVPLVLVALVLPLAGLALADPVPCSDPRGCPDLTVDRNRLNPYREARTFSETSCAVQEGMVSAGTRQLLRFTTTTPNYGAGDLVVGNPADHPEWFEFAKCHNHYHFRGYADYRLWSPAYHPLWRAARELQPEKSPDQVLAEFPLLKAGFVAGNKLGFCFIDLVRYDPSAPASKYRSCSDQGISAGWADVYGSSLDGQWVDVTGVPPGDYVLEVEVNAKRHFVESSYSNNVASMTVRV